MLLPSGLIWVTRKTVPRSHCAARAMVDKGFSAEERATSSSSFAEKDDIITLLGRVHNARAIRAKTKSLLEPKLTT